MMILISLLTTGMLFFGVTFGLLQAVLTDPIGFFQRLLEGLQVIDWQAIWAELQELFPELFAGLSNF